MPTIATEAAQGMIGGLVWTTLLHAVWIGLAAAGGAALAFQTRRPTTHRARHAALLAAMGLVAVGPPCLAGLQRLLDPRPPEPAAIGGEAAATHAATNGRASPLPSETAARDEPSSSFEPRGGLSVGLDRLGRVANQARPVGLALWSVAATTLAAVLALGARGLSRIRLEASPAAPRVQERAARFARLLRLRNAPSVLVHPTLAEPCLCGVFRPVVLLPGRWLASAPVESLDAALAHELAHARRLDHLVNLAQRGLEVLLFFHPGVHWLSRSVRRHGEHCADALAVRLTGDPTALARTLESLARLRAGSTTVQPFGAALGGESTSLLPRIQELLGMTLDRDRFRLWPFAAMPLAAVFACAAASAGVADDIPPATSPQASQGVKPSTPAAPAFPRDGADRQIAYRVRFIDAPEAPWLADLQNDLMPCGPTIGGRTTGGRAWLIADAARDALLKRLESDRATHLLQAPTVTTFENYSAVIGLGLGVDGVESYNPREIEIRNRNPDARTPDRDWRPRIELSGKYSRRGVEISVDLRDATAAEPGGAREVHVATSCDVPSHSNILISLGSRPPDARVGSAAVERLVLVTPIRIVLDAEDAPHADPRPSR